MKKLLAGTLTFFLLACGNKTEEKNLISFLPQETAVVIQSPNLNDFFDEANEIPFLTNEKMEFLGNTRKKLRFLRQLTPFPIPFLHFLTWKMRILQLQF